MECVHFKVKPETAGAEVSVDRGFGFLSLKLQAPILFPFEQEGHFMQERNHLYMNWKAVVILSHFYIIEKNFLSKDVLNFFCPNKSSFQVANHQIIHNIQTSK